MGYAEGRACLSEEGQSEIRQQTNLMGHAKGCTCLSEEGRSEIRQTNLTRHAEGHVCLSESDEVKYGRPIGRGMHRDARPGRTVTARRAFGAMPGTTCSAYAPRRTRRSTWAATWIAMPRKIAIRIRTLWLPWSKGRHIICLRLVLMKRVCR